MPLACSRALSPGHDVPEHRRDPRGGRPRVDDRVCFAAIMLLLLLTLNTAVWER
jgi:hypothetical protein